MLQLIPQELDELQPASETHSRRGGVAIEYKRNDVMELAYRVRKSSTGATGERLARRDGLQVLESTAIERYKVSMLVLELDSLLT